MFVHELKSASLPFYFAIVKMSFKSCVVRRWTLAFASSRAPSNLSEILIRQPEPLVCRRHFGPLHSYPESRGCHHPAECLCCCRQTLPAVVARSPPGWPSLPKRKQHIIDKQDTHFLLYVVCLLFCSRLALPKLGKHFIIRQSHANNFLLFFLQRKLQLRS